MINYQKILELVFGIKSAKNIEINDNLVQYVCKVGTVFTETYELNKSVFLQKCKEFLQKNDIDFTIIYSRCHTPSRKVVEVQDYESNKSFKADDETEFGAIIELLQYHISKFKTSKDWLIEGITKLSILDPDGWDRKYYNYSFNEELISKYEFNQRLMRSTIKLF